jgi:hypothetical protein
VAIPTNKVDFGKYCLRRLGHPTIKINVTDEQVDDRIDEALEYFYRFHYSGSEKQYLAHQLTAGDVSSKSITLDDSILGVVDVFDMSFNTSTSGSLHFNVPYQVLMSELFNQTSSGSPGVSDYVVMRTSLETMRQFMVGKFFFRYNEMTDTLYLDITQQKLLEGNYVMIECYVKNTAADYPDVWNDVWLQKYATAKIKLQWGNNLGKFSGMTLPGGITTNGAKLQAEAENEIRDLEEEVQRMYSPILMDMIG